MDDRDRPFAEFVAARSPALLRTAYLLTGDAGRAEDLLQTALTKTYLAWDRIRDPGAVETYVRRVLATSAVSSWRRRWHLERPTDAVPDRMVDVRADAAEDHLLLWQLVRQLPARQRAVLVLRFYEDMSEAETAEVLGLSRGTVKSHASRGLAALRGKLGEAPVGEEVR
jgi:RNA polymerase sigma-70 factor (ECF subfamily)